MYEAPSLTTGFELISPQQLSGLISLGLREKPLLIEAHFSSQDHPLPLEEQTLQHVPGAVRMHPSFLEAGWESSRYYPSYQKPEDGNLMPHKQLVQTLESIGIRPETCVVVYGTAPAAPLSAARIAWGLMVAGVQSVKMLDGGLAAWTDWGGDVVENIQYTCRDTDYERTPEPTPSSWKMRSQWLATTAEVEAAGKVAARLVDVRTMGEYDGSHKDYYTFFQRAGHIPGATFHGNWTHLIQQPRQEILPKLERIRRRWKTLDIVDSAVENQETTLIFYCGTGWRSSVAFLVALLLGYRAKNYDGGFYEWSWDDRRELKNSHNKL